MQFSYNGYTHADNECQFSQVKAINHTPRGTRRSVVTTLNIRGIMQAANSAALTTALSSLQNAYSDGGDFVLKDNSGANTIISMTSAGTVGGVRVKQFNYPDLTGSAYTTEVPYAITLEAEFPVAAGLLTFNESISIQGTGGPKTVLIPIVNGPPQAQTIYPQTPQVITQAGSCAADVPASAFIPGPLLQSGEDLTQRAYNVTGPNENILGYQRDFRATWRYVFVGNFNLGPQSISPNVY